LLSAHLFIDKISKLWHKFAAERQTEKGPLAVVSLQKQPGVVSQTLLRIPTELRFDGSAATWL
jgi:hypothetical protein